MSYLLCLLYARMYRRVYAVTTRGRVSWGWVMYSVRWVRMYGRTRGVMSSWGDCPSRVPLRSYHRWGEARELQHLLGYTTWRNFELVIEKAIMACRNAKQKPTDHFAGVDKPIEWGKGAIQMVDDYRLTRYACYLIAQNGNPQKQEIAFAMSYFAFSTRKLELIEERLEEIERVQARASLTDTEKVFSGLLYERGIDGAGFARIRSSGDRTFFWGFTTEDMKSRLGIWTTKKPLAVLHHLGRDSILERLYPVVSLLKKVYIKYN